MATEIREAGYQAVRDYIDSGASTPADWDYIELRDDTNSQVLRVSITGDSRAQWVHSAGDQVLEAEIVVSGGDGDVPTPTTFAGSAFYKAASGGSELAYDSFTNATIESSDDQLTVSHRIEVPQV